MNYFYAEFVVSKQNKTESYDLADMKVNYLAVIFASYKACY